MGKVGSHGQGSPTRNRPQLLIYALIEQPVVGVVVDAHTDIVPCELMHLDEVAARFQDHWCRDEQPQAFVGTSLCNTLPQQPVDGQPVVAQFVKGNAQIALLIADILCQAYADGGQRVACGKRIDIAKERFAAAAYTIVELWQHLRGEYGISEMHDGQVVVVVVGEGLAIGAHIKVQGIHLLADACLWQLAPKVHHDGIAHRDGLLIILGKALLTANAE